MKLIYIAMALMMSFNILAKSSISIEVVNFGRIYDITLKDSSFNTLFSARTQPFEMFSESLFEGGEIVASYIHSRDARGTQILLEQSIKDGLYKLELRGATKEDGKLVSADIILSISNGVITSSQLASNSYSWNNLRDNFKFRVGFSKEAQLLDWQLN